MRTRLQDVSVDVDRVPSTSWPLDTSAVADLDLPTLATALTTVVRERAGAALIYPDLRAKSTRIRVEWQLDRKRPYWWRLGIVVSGKVGEPPTLAGYVGPGDAHKSGTLTADAKEIRAISSEIDAVLRAVAARALGTTGQQRPLFYVEFAGTRSIQRDLPLPEFGAEILAAKVVRPNEACVSAVVVTIPDDSKVAARERAMSIVANLRALLTLVSGRPVGVWQTYPQGFLHPGTAPRRRERIYPRRYFREDPTDMRRDFSQPVTVAGQVFGRLSGDDREFVRRMLFAYAAGRDVDQRQPTIAAVAYLAVLSAGLKEDRCESTTCATHGVIARHPLRGERTQIVDRLISRGVVVDDERDDLRRLLNRAYGQQRSAFVHDAEFVHSEREPMRLLGLPTEEGIVSKVWERRDDLMRLETLARGLIFRELSARAGVALVGPPVPVSIRERTGFEGQVHTRRNVRLEVKGLAGRPIYMVAPPGGELTMGLRDLVADRPSLKEGPLTPD